MGAGESKDQIQGLQLRQGLRMHQNVQLANNFAQRREVSVEQMAQRLAGFAQPQTNETAVVNDRKQVEIEGITYEIIQFVNRGGFGEIYKAKARNSNRTVALKIMENTADIREEIKNEIGFLRLTKNIPLENHPVIDYYGCKFAKEGIFIAMELASCDLLTFWFKQAAQAESQEKFFLGMIIIVYVLRALGFLEKLNIIHGDIKPQNLVIVQGQRCFHIKLIDFGTIEKMNTMRAQLTVDASKAHTLFFASPEFLRRDSNNMISRHLHKKSDVWAAGVMFYVLFCEKLPWKDQYDYENFCNDPRARDIIVPQEGGYKLIIELLLKKNPEERSSAKATLMQMKGHPVLGVIVEKLHENFCPVHDVCRMRVPDDVRNDLAKLARPGHFVHGPGSSSDRRSSGSRRRCRYGRDCYRKDSDHREEFAHPGDSDYNVSEGSSNGHSDKPRCRYGSSCYNTDPDHLKKYAHPGGSNHGHSEKQKCRYGFNCNRTTDREHLAKFWHD